VGILNQQPNTPFTARPASYACPSDPAKSRFFQDATLTGGQRFAKGNYAAYCSPYRVETQHLYPGMLVGHKMQNLAAVTDGLSNTALASEVRTLTGLNDQRGAWALPWNGSSLL